MEEPGRQELVHGLSPISSTSSSKDTTNLSLLAAQADQLSKELNTLRARCGHESTSTDISTAAGELQLLAVEISSLDTAVKADKEKYTHAFNQDLAEVYTSLGGIFEDISDCCKEMQKADSLNISAVGWLTKKRYVRRLQKHLEANKTTLIVMRTVLHHGKEYGRQNSPGRLAESSPHTMQEDRAILETVFANRTAIKALHNFAKTSHGHSSSVSSVGTVDSSPSFHPGSHGRNLSSATGVDSPMIEDVLPISENKNKTQEALARRFSRRGVRLAVHSSILDTNAHEVPITLRKKWIHQAHLRHPSGIFASGGHSSAQLSKISEVNSNSASDEPPPASIRHRATTTPEQDLENESPGRPSSSQPSSAADRLSKVRQRGSSVINSPISKQLGNLITRLSRSNLRERKGNDQNNLQVMEEGLYPPSNVNDQDDPSNNYQSSDPKKDLSAKDNPGWSYRLTRPFVKDDLTTPDFEKGF